MKVCFGVRVRGLTRFVHEVAHPKALRGFRIARRAKGQVGLMWTCAQSAKAVNPPGTKALAAAVRFSCSGPK